MFLVLKLFKGKKCLNFGSVFIYFRCNDTRHLLQDKVHLIVSVPWNGRSADNRIRCPPGLLHDQSLCPFERSFCQRDFKRETEWTDWSWEIRGGEKHNQGCDHSGSLSTDRPGAGGHLHNWRDVWGLGRGHLYWSFPHQRPVSLAHFRSCFWTLVSQFSDWWPLRPHCDEILQ